jgi:flagellin
MAQAAASSVNKEMEISMERLATGKRINGASDDAAGVAIASRLTSEIRGTNQAIRNAMDGQALIDTAEGAHQEVENILQRMRELAVQAANDTNDASDRTNIQAELDQLVNEIDRISSTTTWAGQKLLDGSDTNGVNLQIGSQTTAADSITVTINSTSASTLSLSGSAEFGTATDGTDNWKSGTTAGDLYTSSSNVITLAKDVSAGGTFTLLGLTGGESDTAITVTAALDITSSLSMNVGALDIAEQLNAAATFGGKGYTAVASTDGLGTITINKGAITTSTTSEAQTAVTKIDTAIKTLNAQRASLGAYSNRLDSTVSNLTNISSNLQAGRGRIEDADFAAETTSLAKSQILQQASTAMLAQANASKQNVLSLLQG